MNDSSDQTAQEIAAEGRAALVARLRPAFERAAAEHADVLKISPERLEQMINEAADRADGLQWRRALAGVAEERLGLELSEALRHPAVARAQELLGAPSYEAAVGAPAASASSAATPSFRVPANEPYAHTPPEPPAADPHAWAAPDPAPAPTPDPEPHAWAQPDPEPEPTPAPELHAPEPEPEPAYAPEPEDETAVYAAEAPVAEPAEPGDVNVPAVHLGGIANLAPGEEGLELRFADPGLDIARENDAVLGRIAWTEIVSVEVAAPGRMRRRKGSEAKLVIRTARGDASFRVPGLEEDELRRTLAPALLRIPPAQD